MVVRWLVITSTTLGLLAAGCVRAGFSPDAREHSSPPDATTAMERAPADGPHLDHAVPDRPRHDLSKVDLSPADKAASTPDTGTTGPTVATFAGSGSNGHKDGPVATAQFSYPTALALDPAGAMLVADQNNDVIRRISAGSVTTFAGSGNVGDTDGPVAKAEFFDPSGIAVDAAGVVYVADSLNNKIRMISGGTVTTLAGTGSPGFADGLAGSAKFDSPLGLVVDSKGDLFVADSGNERIRRISGGKVSTFAGSGSTGDTDGPAASATFSTPTGLAFDNKGSMLVGDDTNDLIRRVTSGVVYTHAGSGWPGHTDGPLKTAEFSSPQGIATDSKGRIFVADTNNDVIRMIDGAKVTTVAGSGTKGFANGPAATAQFHTPTDLVLDSAGKLYVADQGNDRIRVITW